MINTNPFSELSGSISPEIMQMYVILMVILVVGGVVLDMVHKKSAKYFFENSKKAQKNAKRTVSSGEKVSLAVQTVASEVITSSEFCNPARRVSHLFLMYGFIIFVVSTATLIFGYPTAAEAGIWPMLWHLGAAMVAIGGYWFWFLIRVDRYSEGAPLARLVRADLFIVSLLATVTFALIWSFAGAGLAGWNMLFFGLFVISATVLFGGVIWSKFAHMFFKPAAAYQKKITKADGSQENLPDVGEMNDPAIHARYPDIPEYMGTNPPNMGLGIKRESPNHY
ncbi:adenylyl-sulfate reductase [Solemya velesiana gill symbiont]|nr:adenylyl-sulfate reductase [Solemya velesiana gill symbiont]